MTGLKRVHVLIPIVLSVLAPVPAAAHGGDAADGTIKGRLASCAAGARVISPVPRVTPPNNVR